MENVYFLVKFTVIIIQNYIKLTEYIDNIACIVLIFEYEIGFKLSNSLRGVYYGKNQGGSTQIESKLFSKDKKV